MGVSGRTIVVEQWAAMKDKQDQVIQDRLPRRQWAFMPLLFMVAVRKSMHEAD
jgi:hypothetical protein